MLSKSLKKNSNPRKLRPPLKSLISLRPPQNSKEWRWPRVKLLRTGTGKQRNLSLERLLLLENHPLKLLNQSMRMMSSQWRKLWYKQIKNWITRTASWAWPQVLLKSVDSIVMSQSPLRPKTQRTSSPEILNPTENQLSDRLDFFPLWHSNKLSVNLYSI